MSKEDQKQQNNEQKEIHINNLNNNKNDDSNMFESPRKPDARSFINSKNHLCSPLTKSNSKNKTKTLNLNEKIPPMSKDLNSLKNHEKGNEDSAFSPLISSKSNNKLDDNLYSLKDDNNSNLNTTKEIMISDILNPDNNNYESAQIKRRKEWNGWSLNEKLLFYEIIANGANHSSLQKLFKNMTDVNYFVKFRKSERKVQRK